MTDIVGYRYRIIRKIGQGAFGKVYEATGIKDPTQIYVLKCEPITQRINSLYIEEKILNLMRKQSGFPKVYKLLSQAGSRYLVMERLGRSL
jgi:serine/threonine protein kinase